MEECPFCNTRIIMQSFINIIDASIPITFGADIYDDLIADVFNACDDAIGGLGCFCEEERAALGEVE